jgi:hypothetical protein
MNTEKIINLNLAVEMSQNDPVIINSLSIFWGDEK